MQNAFIYARYSSHGQNEQTIDGQIRVCKEYAKQRGINVVDIYIDKHKTGTDVNRPQFQKMIADTASGRVQYIIVYMIDRFARNRYYSTIYNFQLAQNGVKLLSAMENISESEEGEFYQMFLEWNAEKYSTRLSKRIIEGINTSVANGTFTGGVLIYGYKKDGLKILVDEDEAKVVKYIYEQYADGKSKKEIADDLNAKGYRYKGKLYKGRDLDRTLTNHKYTGVFDLHGRTCDNTYPQIIDKALFDKVQERLSKNKLFSGANSAKATYLLTGKLWCGHCGDGMVAGGGTSKTGQRFYYYVCPTKTKKHACDKKNEKDFLEWYATEQAVNYLSDERRLNFIADKVIEYYDQRTDAVEIRRLNGEISRVQREIDNAVNLLVSGVSADVVKTLDTKIVELSAQKRDLTNYRDKLECERGLRLTKADIINFVKEYLHGELHDKAFQKQVIDNLINAMYIYDDKVVIYFNVSYGSREESYIGKDDTDDAIEHIKNAGGVQTLTHAVHQYF